MRQRRTGVKKLTRQLIAWQLIGGRRVYWVALVILLPFIFSTGSSCETPIYQPVYMSYAELRSSVVLTGPQDLQEPANIVAAGNYLYVAEAREGIHIIDYSVPENPQNVAFLVLPGVEHMLISDTTLFASSYVDMVAIDIAVPTQAHELSRAENVLANNPFAAGTSWSEAIDNSKGVVIDRIQTGSRNWCTAGCVAPPRPNVTPVPLNLAQLTYHDDYLYIIQHGLMRSISVADTNNIAVSGIQSVPYFYAERIFVDDAKLYVFNGTDNYIYDLFVPTAPAFLSRNVSKNICDALAKEGDALYILARADSGCWSASTNSFLFITDMPDLHSQSPYNQWPLTDPQDIAVESSILFIADGSAGLRIADAQDPLNLIWLGEFSQREIRNVSMSNGIAIALGADGLDFYNYSALDNIQLVSSIEAIAPSP